MRTLQKRNTQTLEILPILRKGSELGMKFTEEMINEDEKCWHARDIVTELGYCGNYMRDRKIMTNRDIRFYAYIMRKAHYMLKEQEPIEPTSYMDGLVQRFACGKCGKHLLYATWGRDNFCSKCGREIKWE